jgi:hypothetical protein
MVEKDRAPARKRYPALETTPCSIWSGEKQRERARERGKRDVQRHPPFGAMDNRQAGKERERDGVRIFRTKAKRNAQAFIAIRGHSSERIARRWNGWLQGGKTRRNLRGRGRQKRTTSREGSDRNGRIIIKSITT